MRRITHYAAVITLSITLASCSNGKIRQYAGELAALLDSYSVQVDEKLADEQSRYLSEAERIERRIEEWTQEALEDERAAAAIQTAEQLASKSLRPSGLVVTRLRQYAAKDFQKMKALYEKDMDAHLRHIQNLEDLSIEKAKITALRAILLDMSRKPNFSEQAKHAASFGREVREQVMYLRCADAHATVGRFEQQAKQLRAEINKPAITSERKAELEASLKLVEANKAAAVAARGRTGLFQGGQCQQPGSGSSQGSGS